MSKKSKKIDNVWDLTAEEQQEELEKFAEFEGGEVNIMSLVGNKGKKGLNERGFSAGLESLIVNDQKKKQGITIDDKDDDILKHFDPPKMTEEEKDFWDSEDNEVDQEYPEDDSKDYEESSAAFTEPEVPEKEENVTDSAKEYNGVRVINFKTAFPLDVIHRIVIDDGLCPTVAAIDSALTEKIVGSIDPDEIGEACVMLFNYIITLKHPAAIYDLNDFLNPDYWVFARVAYAEYNRNRYKFFATDTQVFCYVVDDESVKSMQNMLDNMYADDPIAILKIFIGMAYAAGTIHQAFWIEDSEYINRIVLNSKINAQKEFHKMFSSDPTTVKILRYGETTKDDGVEILDAEDTQTEARGLISMMTGDGYFGDEDAYEEEDDEDEEDTDETESEESAEEDEFDGLGDDMEMVETAEPADPVTPIVHHTVPTPSFVPEKKEFKTLQSTPVKPTKTESSLDDLDDLVIPVIRKDRG